MVVGSRSNYTGLGLPAGQQLFIDDAPGIASLDEIYCAYLGKVRFTGASEEKVLQHFPLLFETFNHCGQLLLIFENVR